MPTPEVTAVPEEFCIWTADGHEISIEYLKGVLEQIRLEAVKGITLLRHGGIEVGGVLFGSRESPGIRILGFRPLRSEYAYGPGLVLSQNDEEALKKLFEDAAQDPTLTGMEPLGWYHSHTRSGVFLSEADISVYNRYFPQPWQVALILHPAQLGPTDAGFFFREADGALRSESSYHSFTIHPIYTAAKVLDPNLDIPDAEPELVTRTASTSLPDTQPGQAFRERRALPLPYRDRVNPARESRTSWPWLIAALTLAVLGVAILTGVFHISGLPAGHPTLNLQASDHDGQVHVNWDRAADPIQAAQKASLLIQDGDQKLETPLSGDLLQHGSLVYRRKTGDVEIRLRVYGDEAEPVQESTRLLGLPVTPSAAGRLDAADRPGRQRAPRHSRVSEPAAGESRIQWVDAAKQGVREQRAPVAVETPAAPVAPSNSQPQPQLLARIPSTSAPAPEAARYVAAPPKGPEDLGYRGPSRGRLIWTGHLPANGRLNIVGNHPSTGDITGRLPDVPVKIGAYPASISRGAIVAYAPSLPNGKELREMPGRTNGWTEMVYKRNAKRAGDIAITQVPSARNHWRQIGLRADRKVSVVVIDWEVLNHKR